jgi:hypothetical protein
MAAPRPEDIAERLQSWAGRPTAKEMAEPRCQSVAELVTQKIAAPSQSGVARQAAHGEGDLCALHGIADPRELDVVSTRQRHGDAASRHCGRKFVE